MSPQKQKTSATTVLLDRGLFEIQSLFGLWKASLNSYGCVRKASADELLMMLSVLRSLDGKRAILGFSGLGQAGRVSWQGSE